ncbi:MAG: cysteine desulfurase family protein [Gemmataceae bacterium]
MNFIYFDNNATTPLLPAVEEAMRPFAAEIYGNPASAHQAGRRARKALEDARDCVAALLGVHSDEVLFTSGATESNNLALVSHAGDLPGHILSSPIEHPSVVEPIKQLQERGFGVDWLPVDPQGVIDLDSFEVLLRPETRLATVMLANHETGALQPIRDAAGRLEGRALFHCDAVQAVGKVPVRFHDLGVSTLSLSAHKFHGPKGIGALLVKRGVKLRPQLWGGHQQHGKRPGTEPVALAVGLAKALELACQEMQHRHDRVLRLRQHFLGRLRAAAVHFIVNGPEAGGIPHALNLSFPGLRADALLMNLDLAGIACSTGSACSSGSLLPSPVLQAMRVPEELLHSAMRFSLSPLLTEQEMDEAARRISVVVRRMMQCGNDW